MRYGVLLVVMTLVLFGCDKKLVPVTSTSKPGTPQDAGGLTDKRPTALASAVSITQPCALDLVNDRAAQEFNSIHYTKEARLAGWAANVPAGTVPQKAWIQLTSRSSSFLEFLTGSSGVYYLEVSRQG